MAAYPIGTIAVAVLWWMLVIARAHQRQQRYRQHASPVTPPARPTIRVPQPTPDNPLLRSERLRYTQVNQELAVLRRRHLCGAIGDAEFHRESAALMASLSGWDSPEPRDAVPTDRRYRYDLREPLRQPHRHVDAGQ